MFDSKLIELLKTLSVKELKKFTLFINSPIYNNNKKCVVFFEILKKYHPEYNHPDLNPDELSGVLFANGKDADVQMRGLRSQLVRLLEDFLIFTEQQANPITQEYLLLLALQKRGLNTQFKKKAADIAHYMDKTSYKDLNYYEQYYNFSDMIFQQKMLTDNRDIQDTGLQDLLDSIDLRYLASKLRYTVAAIMRQDIVGEEYHHNFLEMILEGIEKKPIFKNEYYIRLYYNFCLLLTDKHNDGHYAGLKAEFLQQIDHIPTDDARECLVALTNFCMRKIKAGKNNYLREIFEWYKTALQRDWLIVGGFISPFHYKNITTAALKLEEFEWAKQFIKEYATHVRADLRKSMKNYNMAALNFYLKNYDKALEYLNQTDIRDDAYDYPRIKTLFIKTYYEMNVDMSLHSILEAFRIYLTRDKALSEYNRKTYAEFINFVKKLYRVKNGRGRGPQKIAKEIAESEGVVEMQWLLEKANELE